MAAVWRKLVAEKRFIADPYRPERHYMRGPGPKWFAKHGASASVTIRWKQALSSRRSQWQQL
ncbi:MULTISPECIES: hypothetical protein [unclassified Bradyrhizobium]|uniref:hypothetical protein n=1 Tax=unclassified Bradyrhizobium TaxID=2631580 RepID=UPI0024B187BD|nr:hypothetical protein [Bradyrhizobium sp. CB2312]WFU76948.1 hypothetical protein QA642_14140 [Bradyrhizobium sp. CB2312]